MTQVKYSHKKVRKRKIMKKQRKARQGLNPIAPHLASRTQ
jgi:hypothetical protein